MGDGEVRCGIPINGCGGGDDEQRLAPVFFILDVFLALEMSPLSADFVTHHAQETEPAPDEEESVKCKLPTGQDHNLQ